MNAKVLALKTATVGERLRSATAATDRRKRAEATLRYMSCKEEKFQKKYLGGIETRFVVHRGNICC